MRNFMIGQYGSFDYKKHKRDLKDCFFGVEACLFPNDEEVENLIREVKDENFQIGIHFPLRAGHSPLRDALFLSQDSAVRENALDWIHEELEYLTQVKPEYVLFHYPKPVILDVRVDWSNWRFADRKEYEYESQYPKEEFFEKSKILFQWLSLKSEEYDFIPVLEFDALNRYVYESDELEQLLHRYPKIRLCLDTGRLFLQEKIDPYFDSRSVIRKYAKYAEVIHLWNLRYLDQIEEYHYPVLPEQKPEDGWAPVVDYLTIIREENSHVKIQFEHRSDFISDEELERCYSWVNQVWNN